MLSRYFEFEKHGTNYRREILGGITTFVTMAYIIVVNPAILEVAGIPKGPSTVATILSAFFGTLLMGVYAKRPIAIAPYMGENAFIAYTVVKVLGYSWQTALGAIFIGGVLFTLLTLFRLRAWLARAVPENLKYSFVVGIGLFLTFIGLNETGLVALGVPGAPVKLGHITKPEPLLALLCFLLMGVLMIWRVRGAILSSILITTVVAFAFGVTKVPESFVSAPPSLSPIFFKLDVIGAFKWGFFSVILTVFLMDFVDTMGTLIGVSARAGFLDEQGNLPQIEQPMLADALSTVAGALLGTTTCGAYIESAAGIEEGARTGFASVVTAFLFLLALFFAPFLTAIPALAYGPALLIVGILMMGSVVHINFKDYTELIPSFVTIVLMSFTYNLGVGITAGFVFYPVIKVLSGRARELNAGTLVLGVLSLLFYIFYPYA